MALHRISKTLENPVVMTTQSSSLETCLQLLMFSPLNSNGSNFLEWLNDAKIVLAANDLAATLEPEGAKEISTIYKCQTLLTLC